MVLIREQKIKIGKYLINFIISQLEDVKVEKTLFLIPGGIESALTAFKLQLEHLPKLLPNFQIISYDPPGIGKSRPPNRREFRVDGKFDTERQNKDADLIIEGLDKLNVNKYSLLGWSYGARVALIIASKVHDRVDKLIIFGTGAYLDENLCESFKTLRDVSLWPESMRKPFVELYGFEEFKATWAEAIDFFIEMSKNVSKEDQIEVVRKVECSTLIFHGERDFFLELEASKYLHENMKNSRLIITKGGHNLHQKNYREFNQQVADFLTETPKL